MGNRTRRYICTTCLSLLNEKPLDKITVKDIVTKCEINRNTFYYHYHDIYELLEDFFQYESEQVILKQDENITFYEAFIMSIQPFWDYRKAIYNMINSKNNYMVQNYLCSVIGNFIKKFIYKNVVSQFLTEQNVNYITKFYGSVIYYTLVEWFKDGMKRDNMILIKQISDSFDLTIDILINQCLNCSYE